MSKRATALAEAWGDAIRAHREEVRGLSQGEFARELGVSRQTVSYWEAGTYVPSPHWQAELVKRLGLGPNEIHKFFVAAAQDETVV